MIANKPEPTVEEITCPRCGRHYDAALFAFGRTRHCTCGERVGLEPLERDCVGTGRPRFMLDAMLGKLARWLRLLGYDSAYKEHITDEELVRRAIDERRILLTRDRRLPIEWRISNLYLVATTEPFAQLAEVSARFALTEGATLFSRCSACNGEIVDVPRRQALPHVPSRIASEQKHFRHCPNCGRYYWEGSHTQRIRDRLETLRPRTCTEAQRRDPATQEDDEAKPTR